MKIEKVNDNQIVSGLKTTWAGRFEVISSDPLIILDGAHTLNSIKLTLDTLNKLYENEKVDLLFACAADKDIKDISKALQYRFNHVYITRPGDVKHSDLQSADEAFKNAEIDYELNADYKAMINKALSTATQEGNHLLVTGSFYLLAEVFKFLGK